MSYDQIIIGGGLSGLAAGIRLARFGSKVLILEKHSVAGGLNSYYHRQGRLFETGLHAMTNFAPPGQKKAPLNRLFRQLSLSRKSFVTHEQFHSTVLFPGETSLRFANDPTLLRAEVARVFPDQAARFNRLLALIADHDPFVIRPWSSAREKIMEILGNELLVNMLLWPLFMYGSCNEHDMDFDQFVIMFNAVYNEGFFRPAGSISDFLELLLDHYRALGGEIRFRSGVREFVVDGDVVCGVTLESGETIGCGQVISTAGYPATLGFMGVAPDSQEVASHHGRLGFVEMIYVLPAAMREKLKADSTIVFYNFEEPFTYERPASAVNVRSGVICFPENFHGVRVGDEFQVRVTHTANYDLWRSYAPEEYRRMKQDWARRSEEVVSEIIGNYTENIVYQDIFTPLTVERYTGKASGAIYGSPIKIRDGRTPLSNLFIAGTDQGFLGIVGSMLSGVSMVNKHIFEKS
ncbi:MAG: FAD-dependent oxidoreductase [Proteobacteria bacterium]|nr:FAD-dependent oxidoreductase [Pseudomonadota bacterium]MBU1738197.1 FAD-dependent oxidoreductase [Pseudomonadota bacterium]